MLLPAALFAAGPVVSLQKSASRESPKVLDTFRYAIVVDNTGGVNADNTVITDVVPAGLQVVGISAGGVQAGNTITWNLGSLGCTNQVVNLRPRDDTSGGWGDQASVNGSDDVWGISDVSPPTDSTSNWFLLDALTGYSVTSINSVTAWFEWRNDDAADPVTAAFSNDGDMSSQEGSILLTAGLGAGTDQLESWDITGLSTWDFNTLQYLSLYIQHDRGGGGGNSAWMDDMYVAVDFQSCGTSVWYDVVVTNALVNGDVVNNTADVSGSNFSNVSSNNVAVTIVGPEIVVAKQAVPDLIAPGDTVEYVLDYSNQISGLSVYDDFEGNYGLNVANIPNWSAANSNPEFWENTGGYMHHTGTGYSPTWRDDTPNFSDGTISVDVCISCDGSGNGNTSLVWMYQDSGPDVGKFYKSKLYQCGSPSGYCVDVQTGPSWVQVCGNAPLDTFNPAVWNNLKVVVTNYVFQVYVNNVLEFTCDDPTDYLLSPGKAGFYNDGDGTRYDNFRIGDDVPAYNVSIWDTLDPCMTYVGSDPPATVAGSLLSWDLGTLEGGQSGQVRYTVQANTCNPGDVVPNLATGDALNAPSDTAGAAVTVVMPIEKSVDPGTAGLGDQVTYSIAYTATGGGPVVSDDFEDGTKAGRWLSVQSKAVNWIESGGSLCVNSFASDETTAVGSDGRDGMIDVDIYLREGTANGPMFGWDQASGSYYAVTFFIGYGSGDDELRLVYYNGSTETVVDSITGLAIDPTDGSGNTWSNFQVVREGSSFYVVQDGSYLGTLTDPGNNLTGTGLQGLYNHGGDWCFDDFSWTPGARAGAVISDVIPAGMNFVSATNGGTESGGTVSWTMPVTLPGQSVTVQMVLQVDPGAACSPIDNTADLTTLGGTNYNSAVVPLNITCAGIDLVKSVNATQFVLGDAVTFCFDWTATGTDPGPVLIWDTLPSAVTYGGADNGGSQSGSLVSWDLGVQSPGASGTVCTWGTISGYGP